LPVISTPLASEVSGVWGSVAGLLWLVLFGV
jgi:hypothetical protein